MVYDVMKFSFSWNRIARKGGKNSKLMPHRRIVREIRGRNAKIWKRLKDDREAVKRKLKSSDATKVGLVEGSNGEGKLLAILRYIVVVRS